MQLKQSAQTGITENNSGFSIIEAMIAICILSIGLLAVTSMQVSSSSNVRGAGESTEAIGLGTAELEKLMTYSYAELTDPGFPNPGTNTNLGSGDKFDIDWSITAPIDNNPVPNTVTITVNVTWTPLRGDARTITLTSVKSNMSLLANI